MNNITIKEWQDVLEIKNGRDYKKVKDENGKYPIYGSGGVMGYANDYICPPDTVIIGRKGSINNPIYVNVKLWNVDTAFGLVANTDFLYPKYLYYFCVNFNFEKLNTTVTIPSLTKSNLLRIKMALPQLEVQKYISDTLDKVQEIIDGHKKQLEELDNLIMATFYEMFGDPVVNPRAWERKTMDDLIDYMADIGSNGSNATISKNLVMSDTEDYALMIRTVNLNANNFVDNVKYVSKEVYNFFSKSQVFGGEIIMNKIGSAGQLFLMPYLNRPVSLGLNQFLIRVKGCNVTYLYRLLKTDYITKEIERRVRGAVTKSITKSAVREIPILLPPIELQNKFAEIVTKIEGQKNLVKQSIKESETLFNSLLSNYFDN